MTFIPTKNHFCKAFCISFNMHTRKHTVLILPYHHFCVCNSIMILHLIVLCWFIDVPYRLAFVVWLCLPTILTMITNLIEALCSTLFLSKVLNSLPNVLGKSPSVRHFIQCIVSMLIGMLSTINIEIPWKCLSSDH